MPESHHTIFSTLGRILTLNLSFGESIALGVYCLALLSMFFKTLKAIFMKLTSQDQTALLEYQQAHLPDYYEALPEQELEEMVEEEKVFLHDFNSQNMTEKNL